MSKQRRRALTPQEIRTLQLRRIGLRKGYEPAAIDGLLQRLADEIAGRDQRISDLAARLDRAETEAYARRHGTLPAAPNQGRLDDMLAEVHGKIKAQHYADELIASAQRGAAEIVAQSRQQASQILHDAHRAAEQAAHAYRERVGAGYRPDQEELARLLGLTQWAQAQLAELHQQITTTNTTVCRELVGIIDRLHPAMQASAGYAAAPAPDSGMPPGAVPAGVSPAGAGRPPAASMPGASMPGASMPGASMPGASSPGAPTSAGEPGGAGLDGGNGPAAAGNPFAEPPGYPEHPAHRP